MPFCLLAADSSNRFVIGGIFKDGNIFPLGVYSDGKWLGNWEGPNPTTDSGWEDWSKRINSIHKIHEIPLSWISPFSIFPEKWNYQFSNGREGKVVVSSTAIEDTEVGGDGNLCLATRLKSEVYGIAIGGTQSVSFEMPEDVTNESVEKGDLIRLLKNDFERLELSGAQKARKLDESWEEKYKNDPQYDHNTNIFPASLTKLKQLEQRPTIDGLFEKKTMDGDFYFFSLVKKYPTSVENYKYNLVSYMFGWAVQAVGKPLKIIQEKMSFIDGDGKVWGLEGNPDFSDLYDLTPVSCFRLDDKMYWLFHADFNEAEDFMLLNIDSNDCNVVKLK